MADVLFTEPDAEDQKPYGVSFRRSCSCKAVEIDDCAAVVKKVW
jgi:hypothetical protein